MTSRRNEGGWVGSFEHLDSLLEAVAALKTAGLLDFEVFTPVPRHEIERAIGKRRSPVRYVTFFGAVFGLVFGFGLAIGTSLVWNLIVGGKPIVSIPPFLVVGFELTILFGGIATLLAVLHFSRVPGRQSPGYHPRFSDDRFGLFVHVSAVQKEAAKQLLQENHAEETWWAGEEPS